MKALLQLCGNRHRLKIWDMAAEVLQKRSLYRDKQRRLRAALPILYYRKTSFHASHYFLDLKSHTNSTPRLALSYHFG